MKHALITGSNRGLGLEFARQLKDKGYYVTGCCRQPSKAADLNKIADRVFELDITKDEDIRQLVGDLDNKPVDLLVNNAGTSGAQGVTVGNIERNNFLHVLNVNCVSTVKLTDALLPNLQASAEKNILVVSSRMGSIADNDRGRSYAYRSSKAALNCAMRSFAIDVRDKDINIMLIHPGWVKTDMGGKDARIDVTTSVAGMLEQVALHMPDSHAGELRRFDGGIISW